MNNQSYLLSSERAGARARQLRLGAHVSPLSATCSQLNSRCLRPVRGRDESGRAREEHGAGARPRQPTRSSCCSKGILMLGLRPCEGSRGSRRLLRLLPLLFLRRFVDVVAVYAAAK